MQAIKTGTQGAEMSEELKPCPFCGNEVELNESSGFPVVSYRTQVFPSDNKFYYITCKTEGCFIKSCPSYESKEKIIRIWNTRRGNEMSI